MLAGGDASVWLSSPLRRITRHEAEQTSTWHIDMYMSKHCIHEQTISSVKNGQIRYVKQTEFLTHAGAGSVCLAYRIDPRSNRSFFSLMYLGFMSRFSRQRGVGGGGGVATCGRTDHAVAARLLHAASPATELCCTDKCSVTNENMGNDANG